MHASLRPQTPALDECVHCDVVRARRLHPVEGAGEPSPVVVAQLVSAGGELLGVAVKSSAADTLEPVWDEGLLLPDDRSAASVRFSVFSNDKLALLLGSVDLPLPQRPLPPGTHTRGSWLRRRQLPHITEGWFPLRDESDDGTGAIPGLPRNDTWLN
jgi:hypothetical protein